MRHDVLNYEANGLQMESHFYVDDSVSSGRRPGVLIFPEAFGLGAHVKGRAERLAKLGYAALACDIHGHGKLYGSIQEIMPIIGALRDAPLKIRAIADGGLRALCARPEVDPSRIAAIGYCFGGTTALELARGGRRLVPQSVSIQA